jgi:hypothetical protein
MNKWLRTSGAALKAVAHLDSWKDGSWQFSDLIELRLPPPKADGQRLRGSPIDGPLEEPVSKIWANSSERGASQSSHPLTAQCAVPCFPHPTAGCC